MKSKFIDLIVNNLTYHEEQLRQQFLMNSNREIKTRYFYLDNFLPAEITQEIYHAFPPVEQMRLLSSFRERKRTYKQLDKVPEILKDITFAIQDQRVLDVVERITGIQQQEPDATLYAGGLSEMVQGDFLNPHLDNSHNRLRTQYRTVNLLFYVTPDWKEEYGGNLELWNDSVTQQITIASVFNRFVVMETNRNSWHSVSPVKYNGKRCCVSNYYFSPVSPEGEDYFNITSFSARPDQHFRRLLSKLDSKLRQTIRKVAKFGLGKKDVYNAK